MHYILMDLEWNQPLSHLSAQYRKYGKLLMFDIIQIGAVKLDENRRMVGSFNRFIQPGLYKKLHPRITRITGISQDDLYGAVSFTEAFARFKDWCGEEFTLITWGSDDISVFQQNLNYYLDQVEDMPPMYDLQRLFGAQVGNGKNRAGLALAMKHFGISTSPEHPLHSAVDDAYYTALVFQKMPDFSSVLEHKQAVRELVPAKNRKGEKADDLAFSSLAQAVLSRAANEPNCPSCGKRMKIPEGFVPMSDYLHRALADCPEHGLVLVDLTLTKNKNGETRVQRRASLSDQQNPAYVRTKHLQWANKVAALAQQEVS